MNQQNPQGRIAVVGVVLALVAGCSPSAVTSSQPTSTMPPTPPATAAPTLAPSATPVPTPAAAPSAASSEAPQAGWPYTSSWEIRDALFAEDGRVVLIESHWEAGEGRIAVLDKDGSTVPGWPWTPGPTGDAALGAAFGPDGSLYVAARGATDEDPSAYSWSLHRLSRDGKEMAGFPLDLPAVPFCDLEVNDDAAYVSCGDEEAGATSEVKVVEPDGKIRDGWPVGLGMGAEIAGFGPDGRVYLQTWGQPSTITALASDGTKVAGWPRKIRGVVEAGVQIDDQGRVRVTSQSDITQQCGLPDKTVYTMLLGDGSTAPGWPVTVKGWSSVPELSDDGTMVVTSATGKVTAYSSRGAVEAGWPVSKVGVSVGCGGGSLPWAAGDGTTVVVGDGRATLLTADGQVASGWPVTLPYELADDCGECTPGPGAPMDPTVGKRAVYIGAYQGEQASGTDGTSTRQPRVMVVERDGSMPSDAQLLIGTVGDNLSWLRIAPTGRVWALTISHLEEGEAGALYLVAEDTAQGS
jgi:hypothetical protein